MRKGMVLFLGMLLISACTGTGTERTPPYTNLTPTMLSEMLVQDDVILVDVHVPEQPHIPGTDLVIPYNDLDALEAALPNKEAKIVLYCRSGHMSRIAATELAKRGYTNLYNLAGGENAWRAAGYEVIEKEGGGR